MSKSKKVLTRIVFGAIMITILTGLLYLDYWLEATIPSDHMVPDAPSSPLVYLPMVAVLCAILIVAFYEVNRLAVASGCQLLSISGLALTFIIATGCYWANKVVTGHQNEKLYFALITPAFLLGLGLLAMFLEQMIRFRIANALRNISATLLAVIYLGICGLLIFAIRVQGIEYLVLFLAAVKSTDIGAYFTGSAIGKHKMIPWLSPGKSWEGLIGGLATAAGVSVLVAWAFGGIGGLEVWELIVFGVVMGIAGQFADLCESLLKRSANVKDSGSKVPEFGGVLDIIDSPLLAAPVAIIMLAILS